MTRETKIGLLVGLAFIIMIGILLSDHFRGANEAPPALLTNAGGTARLAANVPGSGQTAPQITMPPTEVTPPSRVQTSRDIDPPTPPVVPGPIVVRTPAPAHNDAPQPETTIPNDLRNIARQNGQELVPVDPNNGRSQTSGLLANGQQSYTAGPGDTVSKMAARFLGANTRVNREAIVRANPALQQDANKVIVGQVYVIPGAAVAMPASAAGASTDSSPSVAGADVPDAHWTYTVKSGDTLWGIANDELDDPSAVPGIVELNRDVLHGKTTVRAGMKLRLPARPIASAN